MQLFFKKLFGLGMLVLFLATIAQFAVVVRAKDKTINGHDLLLVAKGADNAVACFGSSRCADHYIPKVFQNVAGVKVINLGINGHNDIPLFYMMLQYYLKYNPKLKGVVLNFDAMFTPGKMDLKGNPFLNEKHNFSRYAFFAQPDNDSIVQYFGYDWGERFLPLYAILRYKVFLDCITMSDGKLWQREGYLRHDSQWDSTMVPIAREQRYGGEFSGFPKKYDSVKQQLTVFRDLCRSHGLSLLCVQSPVFRELYDSSIFSLPKKMCAELEIPFVDLAKPELCSNYLYFSDPLHLNTAGATLFSTLLAKDSCFMAVAKGIQ